MGRPRIGEFIRQAGTLTMDVHTWKIIEEIAKKEGISRSRMIENMVMTIVRIQNMKK